jgi:hypothetical protein
MKQLAKLDLYKVVIVASLLLLPAVGWWINTTRASIEAAERALTEATKTDGLLEEIGKLQKQLRTVEENRASTSNQTGNSSTYFDAQIFRSAVAGQLEKNQFNISPPREENVTTGQKQAAKDIVVKIDWMPRGGKEFTFRRDFLFAVLFNCESSARSAESAPLPSIWKLYSLKITNATVSKLVTQQMTPPAELEDDWIVSKMEFARREPRKKDDKR